MKAVAIIPARMGSSRFPGKPLAKIQGMPMIGHCYLRTQMCEKLHATYVATCDQEIYDYIKSIGGNVVMTSDVHERATERAGEALTVIEEELKSTIDVVAMVQGDEPLVMPQMLSQGLEPFELEPETHVVNLIAHLNTVAEFEDRNEVKLVIDRTGHVMYFSREPIPSRKMGFEDVPMLKQLGIIFFRRDALIGFNQMETSTLERIESVDMNRLLESGVRIKTVLTEFRSLGVDTEADLKLADEIMEQDTLLEKYLTA